MLFNIEKKINASIYINIMPIIVMWIIEVDLIIPVSLPNYQYHYHKIRDS